ncbi:MAG: DNA-binding response regulator, partial [Lysobacterales bacterium CG_4_9_14_3_um_filter_62_6]
MISVCLVDDQTLVRQGIRSLLELSDCIRVVAEAADGAQAISVIPRVKPDVVLLDMRMPKLSGLDVLKQLHALGSLPPTIILTTFDDEQLVLAGLKAGARGFLLKDVSLEQLVDAVKAVAAGGSLVKPVVTERLLAGLEHMHNQFASLEQPDALT